jgi:protein-histidine N-methyltransferase
MNSTFSFGFSGDDIDIDDSEVNDVHEKATFAAQEGSVMSTLPELVPAKRHQMTEWVSAVSPRGCGKYSQALDK